MSNQNQHAQDTIFGIVRKIVAQKRAVGQIPAVAFLREITPQVPWGIQITQDILMQAEASGLLVKGSSVNLDYWTLHSEESAVANTKASCHFTNRNKIY